MLKTCKRTLLTQSRNNPHLLILDEPTNFLDRDSLGGLAVAIRDYKGGVVMINMDRFEDSPRPGSSLASSAFGTPSNLSSAVSSAQGTPMGSGAQSEAEGQDDMKFRARKKKKLTKKQLKEREVRRRLRHIDWLNSPKGTPHPPDTDDDEPEK